MPDDCISVLLVEDDPDDALVIHEILEENAHRRYVLEAVERLEDGLGVLDHSRIDVALLDLTLPDSMGIDTPRRVRDAHPALPVVLLTGLDDERVASLALQEGCQDYLVKDRIDARMLDQALLYAVERKRMETMLVRSERLAAVGTLAGGVAHEFNNLNNIIINSVELVRENGPHSERVDRWLAMALTAGRRAAAIASDLLAFSSGDRNDQRESDLGEIVARVLRMQGKTLEREGVAVEYRADGSVPVRVDAGRIEQAVMSIVTNARDAMRGVAEKRLCITVEADADDARVAFADTGRGVAPDDLARVFSPFFSTKGVHAGADSPEAAQGGTGLGLSIAQNIVRAHGGDIHLDNAPGGGAVVVVRLPVVEEPPPDAFAERVRAALDEVAVSCDEDGMSRGEPSRS